MRISDWSSDVCSSDLGLCRAGGPGALCLPVGIAAGDDIDLARAVEAEGHGDGAIEEVAVVADQQHGSVIVGDHFLEQVERFEIEVRSEERRVGKEYVSKCRSRWSPDH